MAMMDMFAGKGRPSGGKPQMASKGGLYAKPAVKPSAPRPVRVMRRGPRGR